MNIAVIMMISIVIAVVENVFNINLSGSGYGGLLIFSAIIGFAGSFTSLLLSRWSAKRIYKISLITPENLMTVDNKAQFTYRTIEKIVNNNGLAMPEVGVYQSPDPNAFATGASKKSSLVAVSSGLLNNMTEDEIEGVLGHEIAHIQNGDMVTMTLLQGVLNTFVIFLSRAIGMAIDSYLKGDREGGYGIGYYLSSIILQIVFGMLASLVLMAFSRKREFKADSGSALYTSRDKMVAALQRLQNLQPLLHEKVQSKEEDKMAAFKISNNQTKKSWKSWFSSHPDLSVRIEALKQEV